VSTPGGIEFNKNCNRIRYIKIISIYYKKDFHPWDKDKNYMLNRIKNYRIRYISRLFNLLYKEFHHWEKDKNCMLNVISEITPTINLI